MKNRQTLISFYHSHFEETSSILKEEIGHFNVFPRNKYPGPKSKNLPYSRKDFYKISLFIGKTKIYYGDQIFEVEKSALLFTNPQISYGIDLLEEDQSGFFCIFSENFFSNTNDFKQYPVFKHSFTPVFLLTDDQTRIISQIYLKMLQENKSNFIYKYDFLRNLVLELILTALKMLPTNNLQFNDSNGAIRISSLFNELLEKQFPIEPPIHIIELRSPLAFADQLSIHVNYLNRSLKEVTGRTTTQLITERIIQEAKGLLIHTNWNISEIAWCLGYKTLPHFITSFKNITMLTPKIFRKRMQA